MTIDCTQLIDSRMRKRERKKCKQEKPNKTSTKNTHSNTHTHMMVLYGTDNISLGSLVTDVLNLIFPYNTKDLMTRTQLRTPATVRSYKVDAIRIAYRNGQMANKTEV